MNANNFKKKIDTFAKKTVLVIGDLMMDRFIWGKVDRISPEAPVPVVQVEREEDRPGGAGNVIYNLTSLGAKVFASGIVGMDNAGERLVRDFEYLGVRVEGILLDPARPTSLKTRVLATHQHIVRFDRESKVPISPEFERKLLDGLSAILGQVDAVILSDYGKGLITPRLISWITQRAGKSKLPVFVDPKPENFKLYKKVTCVTPNITEAFLGMGQLPKNEDEPVEEIGKKIMKMLGLQELIITRGAQGMTVFTNGSRPTHIPTQAREVFDVTGAGDTVISTYALAHVAGASAIEAAQLANLAAGIVVGKPGTATVSRPELAKALEGGD